MGHIAHLRKKFKSINTYDYHNVDSEKKKTIIYFKRIEWFFIWTNYAPMDALCQILLKLAQWFWRRRFLNYDNVFLLFRNHPPLEKGRALHLNKLQFSSPKDDLHKVWLKLTQWFLRRRFLKILSMYFCYFVIISPWKRAGAL